MSKSTAFSTNIWIKIYFYTIFISSTVTSLQNFSYATDVFDADATYVWFFLK